MTAKPRLRDTCQRIYPIFGLMILLSGCVTHTMTPPCSPAQRIGQRRQENMLRHTIVGRQRSLAHIQAQSNRLNCVSHSAKSHAAARCLKLTQRHRIVLAELHREQAQLKQLGDHLTTRHSVFEPSRVCVEAVGAESIPPHRAAQIKHTHPRNHRVKASPLPAIAVLTDSTGLQPHEGPNTAIVSPKNPQPSQALQVPKGNVQQAPVEQPWGRPAAESEPPEHAYVADPHMRVIGSNFIQDEVKLPPSRDAN